MDVLVVTAELAPYARVTHAADTVTGLAKTLVQNGHAVTIAAPRYPSFERGGLLVARRLSALELAAGGTATVFDGQLPSGAKVVLFEGEGGAGRDGEQGDADGPPGDGAERYGLLCQAAAALVAQRRAQGQPFHVVHAFDWAAAPALALVAAGGGAERAVLTVTDTETRGDFPAARAAALGLSEEARRAFVTGSTVSYLAMGTSAAHAVVLGSPTHARDLLSGAVPDPTGLLAGCGERLTGILDGVDYSIFNPATDAAIKSRFSAEDVASKGTCKTDIVRTQGLELDVARPLVVAFVDDAADAATLGALGAELSRLDMSLLCVGAGAPGLGELVTSLGPRAAAVPARDAALLRRLVSGADIVLCPRAYARSAVLPRVAQRYGAVPVGFAAGATLDAVVDADEGLETGTGFLAEPGGSLVAPLRRAIAAYASERWSVLRRRIMRQDLGWDRPARRYAQLYRPPQPARAAAG